MTFWFQKWLDWTLHLPWSSYYKNGMNDGGNTGTPVGWPSTNDGKNES
jgi:hypothetical protein